jgi:DeoR/GlpR family transcriptional regulator of sugar metabolism
MKRAIRKDEILDILSRYNYVTVDFLADALYISPSSIRRDLAILEDQGLVRRSHGGVHSIQEQNALTPYSLRMQENIVAKRSICKKAVELISDGDVVFIDGSTTCLFLPELLENKKNITVLTNSLRLAGLFKKSNNVKVYCTGGLLRLQNELVAAGPIAEQICAQIHTNIMLFSSRAIDENGIIYDLNEPETSLRKIALRNTDKAVFLCDSSKFGKHSTFSVCRADELSYIVTDVPPNSEISKNWNADKLLWI